MPLSPTFPARNARATGAKTGADQPRLTGAVFLLTLAAAVAALVLQQNLLSMFGVDYLGPGSNPLVKIHPSTYLTVAAAAWFVMSGDIGKQFNALLFSSPRMTFYTLSAATLTLYVALAIRREVSIPIDTWIVPGLLLALLSYTNERQRHSLALLVHLILLANSAAGVYEFFTGNRVIPGAQVLVDYASGEVYDLTRWQDWRAMGIFGHPLTATLITAIVAVTMTAQIAFDKATPLRGFALAHSLIALPCFGGRTSVAVCVVLLALILVVRGAQFMSGKGASMVSIVAGSLVILFMPAVLVGAYNAGAFDNFLARLEDDSGSAATRLVAVKMLELATPIELWFGDLNNTLAYRQRILGTTWGVEVFWIAFILQYGLIIAGLVFAALGAMLVEIAKQRGPIAYWPMICFVLALSSGTGLASKTQTLSMLVVLMCAMFPLRAATRPAAHRESARPARPLTPSFQR